IDAHEVEYDIVSWALEPGLPRARRVFSARWVGDDASFADRGGVTSPPFPELTLRDGDPLDSPLFPQVWPRA
ncbi:phytanoyl-CoA dioxygenase, partial [Klebsiella pneumoniae subsp. pneumoniae]